MAWRYATRVGVLGRSYVRTCGRELGAGEARVWSGATSGGGAGEGEGPGISSASGRMRAGVEDGGGPVDKAWRVQVNCGEMSIVQRHGP